MNQMPIVNTTPEQEEKSKFVKEFMKDLLQRVHLENILLHFFESLPNPEAACAFLSADERKVLEDTLDAVRARRNP